FWSDLAAGSSERMSQLHQFVEPLKSWLFAIAGALAGGLLHMLLSLLIAFFLYRDGAATAAWAGRITDRLGGAQGRALLDLAGGGGGLSFIVILLGILGGATTFGFIGVFLGPTLLAVGVEILRFWTSPAATPAAAGLAPATRTDGEAAKLSPGDSNG